MIRAIDENIAKIRQSFEENKLWDDTFVIFLSDNGAPSSVSQQQSWLGGKSRLWEGGIRVPSFVRGTNSQLARTRSGEATEALHHCTDLFPSIVSFAKLNMEKIWKCRQCHPHGNKPLDGINQWGNWKSDGNDSAPRKIIVHSISPLHLTESKINDFVNSLDPFLYDISAYESDNFQNRIIGNVKKAEKLSKKIKMGIIEDIENSGGGTVSGHFNIPGIGPRLIKLIFSQSGKLERGKPWLYQTIADDQRIPKHSKLPKLEILNKEDESIRQFFGLGAFLLDVSHDSGEQINLLGLDDFDKYKAPLSELLRAYAQALENGVIDRSMMARTLDIAQLDPVIGENGEYFQGSWGNRSDAVHEAYICKYK
uniref:Sulfatase N-terminal domain-containing protein n=1 Tax=Aplanochytrium stocchinoi TaxID=215587 RepID=A0A7S3PG11_9STRA